MREFSAALVLLFFCVSTSAASPSSSSSHQPQVAPWRRFTNGIISKLWGVPDCQFPLASKTLDIPEATRARTGRLAARYGQDIVLRFNVSTAAEARALAEASEDLYLDVWEFSEEHVDIRLAKDVVPSLLGLLPPSLQHAHAPLMPHFGLAEVIDKSLPSLVERPREGPSAFANLMTGEEKKSFTPNLQSGSAELFFEDYQPLSVISPWMRLMASMFPTHVRLITIGVSWEGRDIEALRVGVKPTNNDKPTPRKTIIISGGLHAREWISTSTVTYTAYRMITMYGRSSTWTSLLEAFDWVFIPTLNPDGYVYTWETDRLWRKNRQPTSLRFCRGLDLDRSFGFQWDGDASGGNPCSESFAGEEAWQAVESKRFADWARNETENNNVEFRALLDLHSYSQQVLYPYSYSCADSPPTLENLEELAMGLAKALRMGNHPHYYKTTSACEGNVNPSHIKGRNGKHILPRIERGGGSALDWFYHELRIKYAFQIKLRDMGSYGFMLPKENIIPQGKEMMSAITYLGRYLVGELGLENAEESSDDEHRGSQKVEVKQPIEEKPELYVESSPPQTPLKEPEDSSDMQWELKRRRRR